MSGRKHKNFIINEAVYVYWHDLAEWKRGTIARKNGTGGSAQWTVRWDIPIPSKSGAPFRCHNLMRLVLMSQAGLFSDQLCPFANWVYELYPS